jgi:hypothetical protein
MNNSAAVRLDIVDRDGDRVSDGYLVAPDPLFEARCPNGFARASQCGQCRAAVVSSDALQPRAHGRWIGFEPGCGRGLRLLVLIQDGIHHLVLTRQCELQVLEQLSQVGTGARVTGTGVRVDGRAAEVGAEHGIAPRQVAQIEAHVHGVRIPGQEHDRLVVVDGALDLRQHSLFARLDELEVAQAEQALPDHAQDQPVAVVARLNTVDGVVELGGEAPDIGKVVQAGLVGVGRNRQGVFGSRQVGADDVDRVVLEICLAVSFHGGHPVAEKDIDVFVLHRSISYRHRQHRYLRFVAKLAYEGAEQSSRGRHVCPSDVRYPHNLARGGIGRR